VIHFHSDYIHFPLVRRHQCAGVTTLHGVVHPHDLPALLDQYRDVPLFLGEMLTATAMGFFEQELSRALVLALFVPLIISSGGNSGSHASTLVIRALALREMRLRDWWRVARRELVSGLALGGLLGLIGFCRIAGWSLFTDLYGPHWLLAGATVALALVGVVL
jgi:magnesium transporter